MEEIKERTKELREKLFSLNSKEIAEVFEAVSFAKEMHVGQLRVGGEPYIHHPLRVAIATAEHFSQTNRENMKVAVISALLHDVVEDTEATLAEVGELFGDNVAKTVNAVSHTFNSDGSVNENEPDEIFLERVKDGGPIAIVVKRFDVLDNLASVKEAPEDFFNFCLNYYDRKLEIWKKVDPEGWPEVKKAFLKAKKDGFKK